LFITYRFPPARGLSRVSVSGMTFFQTNPHGVCLRTEAVQRFGRNDVNTALANGEVLSPWLDELIDYLGHPDLLR